MKPWTTAAALVATFAAHLANAETPVDAALKTMSWDQIVDAAQGGTVNMFMWGGSDTINAYVSQTIGDILKSDYGITMNRVALTDTVEAVNIVLGEKEAGVADNGAVDLRALLFAATQIFCRTTRW
jgi:putative spermidine/putrescine transport system substrate-binding protein